MKKISLLVILMTALFLVTGCGEDKKEETKTKNVEGTLTEIMEKLYSSVPEENMIMGLTNIEVNDENIEMYLGTKDIDYKEVLASESMVGSFAHSVVLIRAEKGADIEAMKKEIKDKVNPRKWVCVWVEEEDVIIKNKGDLIIVNIVEDEVARKAIDKAFDSL